MVTLFAYVSSEYGKTDVIDSKFITSEEPMAHATIAKAIKYFIARFCIEHKLNLNVTVD